MKTIHFFKLFSLTSIMGCVGLQPSSMPADYSIKLNEHGGMMPYGTSIFLSNKDSSYVEFYVDGLKNKINIFPTEEELSDLVNYMLGQKFNKIKSREEEVYDRGGDAITVLFDGERITASNMGFQFIKPKWLTPYSNIKDRIFNIAKKQLPTQLLDIDLVLDTSLLKEGWLTSIDINDGIFIGKSAHSEKEGFEPNFKISAIPGNNMFNIYVFSIAPNQRKREIVIHWNQPLVLDESIHRITFALVDGDIQAFYTF